jgi:hypothetical protein
MQLMDSKRPFGRAAVVLAGLLSMASGWMALAGAPDSESKPVEASPIDESPIAFTWQDAEVLIELGILQVDEYSADGGAVATLAASGSGPTVVVIPDDAGGVVPPCKSGWVPGPGGGCISGGWQLFDYPPRWKFKKCVPGLLGMVDCHYVMRFEFLRTSTGCVPKCSDGKVCVEAWQYDLECVISRAGSAAADCGCPSEPYGPDQGGCATPTTLPGNPGVSPGGALPPFKVTYDKHCYKPGDPW